MDSYDPDFEAFESILCAIICQIISKTAALVSNLDPNTSSVDLRI